MNHPGLVTKHIALYIVYCTLYCMLIMEEVVHVEPDLVSFLQL